MLTVVTPPSMEPVSLAAAKLHLKMDDVTADDTLISALITGVRKKFESWLDRSFVATVWLMTLDGFPGQFSRFSPALGTFAQGSYGYGMGPLYGYIPERLLAGTAEPIVIPKARLVSVSSITYQDSTTGNVTTLDPSLYSVEPGDGGRISPAFNHVWPSARVYPGSIQITTTMGYGTLATDVPETITSAMLLMIAHLYQHRSAVDELTLKEAPMTVRYLLEAEDWGLRL